MGRRPYGLALMGPDRYSALLAMRVPKKVIARDARRVVAEKPVAGDVHAAP
jgi:hypothetical protein